MSIKDKLIKFNIFTLFMLLPIIDSLRRTTIKDIEIFNLSLIEFVKQHEEVKKNRMKLDVQLNHYQKTQVEVKELVLNY